jgi:competence protein ComEA
VRAVLGDVSPAPTIDVAPSTDGGQDTGDSGVLPWLPGEDLDADLRAAPSPGQAPATRAHAPNEHHGPGSLDRLWARLPIRLDATRRSVAAIGVAVLLAAATSLIWVLSSRPHAIAVESSDPSSAPVRSAVPGESVTAGPSAASTSTLLVVDVAGKVRHPGLYRLPAGSRVDDAVRAAGGVLPGVDLTSLNLAAKVADGQQIAVGLPGAVAGPAPAGSSPASGAAGGPVDLNTASLEQLDALPGIGPVLAQHILDWRAAHGRFATVDQLREVSGIGTVKFDALRPLVTV